jgi:hypothetical protein
MSKDGPHHAYRHIKSSVVITSPIKSCSSGPRRSRGTILGSFPDDVHATRVGPSSCDGPCSGRRRRVRGCFGVRARDGEHCCNRPTELAHLADGVRRDASLRRDASRIRSARECGVHCQRPYSRPWGSGADGGTGARNRGTRRRDATVAFSGDGGGTQSGLLGTADPVVAGRWTGSGRRTGRLRFSLNTDTVGAYSLPVRFVLSAP